MVAGLDVSFVSRWPLRLWDFDKHYQYIGGQAARASATERRRRSAPRSPIASMAACRVNIQNDGDLMYAPGRSLDRGASPHSAAERHAQQPRLSSGVMHVQRMANRHQRGITTREIGTRSRSQHRLRECGAQSMGVYGEGPITDPNDLGPALQRAIEVVSAANRRWWMLSRSRARTERLIHAAFDRSEHCYAGS